MYDWVSCSDVGQLLEIRTPWLAFSVVSTVNTEKLKVRAGAREFNRNGESKKCHLVSSNSGTAPFHV